MTFDGITRNQVRELARRDAEPSISIYLPTSRCGADVLQGRIVLKNLLTKAEEELVRRGMRHTLAIDLLEEARLLDEDTEFWNDRMDGVALFISPEQTQAFHLPYSVPESLHVGKHFFVRPLLRTLTSVLGYYVLALDMHRVRLVRCGPRGAFEVDVPDMPETIEAFLAGEHSEKQLQLHTAGRVGHAGSVIGHGAGDKGADLKDRQRRFCTAIARAVEEHLAPTDDPVVLFGTEELQNAYRSVSKLHHLIHIGIVGSPKLFESKDLRAKTQPVIDEYSDIERRKATAQYRASAGTGLSSQQIEEILPAAEQGRVDVLFDFGSSSLWGTRDGDGLQLHERRENSDEEFINTAAIATVENNGTVFSVSADELGAVGPVAALYRY